MTTSNVLGVVPKLLPVTATFAAPIALINAYLQFNCTKARMSTKTALGRDSSTSFSKNPATRASVTVDGATGEQTYNDPVLVATSMHTNFVENAPFALLFAAMVELNGGSRKALTWTLGVFTLARVAHAVGIAGGKKTLIFRQLGFFASAIPLLGLSGWSAYLVSSYWGL